MIHDHKMRKTWFVAGLGLGAVAGILLAPKSGRELREAIAGGLDRGRKYLDSLGRDARKRATDVAASGKKILVRKKKPVRPVAENGHDQTDRV